MMKINSSASLRLLVLLGLVGANLLLIAVGSYALYQSRLRQEAQAETAIQNIASALDQSVSGSVERIDLALRTVVDELEHQLASGRLDERAVSSYLERLQQRLPELEGFRIADESGLVFLGKGVVKSDGVSWADRDYFIRHKADRDAGLDFRKPRVGRVAKKYIINLSRRFNYPDGRFAGVVSAPISVDYFYRLLGKYDIGPKGTLILRYDDLSLVTRVPEILDQPAGQIGHTGVSAELRKLTESGLRSATYHITNSPDGFERILSYRHLDKIPIYVIVGTAIEDYLGGWKIELYKTAAITIGSLLLSLLLGMFLLRLLAQSEKDQARLHKSEMHLKTIIANEPQCIKILDGEGKLLEMNAAGLAMIEADSLTQVIGQPVTDIVCPEDRPAFAAVLNRVLAGESVRHEFEIEGLKGTRRILESHAVPMEYDGARVLLGVTRDITERKQAEAELAQYRLHLEQLVQQRTSELLRTEERATHILHSSADGLYGMDENGFITFINPAGCAMLGYRAEEVMGRSAHALFHHSRPDGSRYPVEECPSHRGLKMGLDVRIDNEVYWHADGHAVPVMYAMHPIVNDGVVTGAVTSFVDVSEQRAAALAREKAMQAAENLARVRSEFLSNMSHEIRTPINGVLGFAQIGLRNYQNSETARNAFEKILISGDRLLGVINDILDFSKIEAGKLKVEQVAVMLHNELEEVVDVVRPLARAKHIELRVVLAPDLPQSIIGDPLRISQVLLNLLSNAVKFTDEGWVCLEAKLDGDMLVFRVMDSGIGISEAQIRGLFDPFQQADGSTSRRFGGTGLGLTIAKRIAELMEGDIRVESQENAGSTFEFRLPCFRAEAPALPAMADGSFGANAPQKRLAGLAILVAEDEAINQQIMEENLREEGASVVMVGNGRDAVERIAKDGGAAYDAVLMDIQMPGMDGFEATRRVLAMAPDVPVIGQTAHAFADDRQKCLDAGMVDHITKPIHPETLVATILRHAPAVRDASPETVS